MPCDFPLPDIAPLIAPFRHLFHCARRLFWSEQPSGESDATPTGFGAKKDRQHGVADLGRLKGGQPPQPGNTAVGRGTWRCIDFIAYPGLHGDNYTKS
jgi:hypothetical protein